MAQKEIPCYLFVGMLESGKTKFIQETMEDPQFDSGDKTLLLICEEGEEEYDSERFAFGGEYGAVLRAKGIVDGGDTWYEFDMVPGEHEIRTCGPDVTGKVCVIGSQLKEHEVEELFHA